MFQYRPRRAFSRGSLFIAIALTGVGFGGSFVAMHEIRYFGRGLETTPSASPERVVLLRLEQHASSPVTPRPTMPARVIRPPQAEFEPRTEIPAPPPTADTASRAATVPVLPARGAPSRVERISIPRVGPADVTTRAGVARLPFASLDSAARDTISRLHRENEAAAWSKPARLPQSLVDREQRELYRERAERLAEKRPYPIRAGGSGASGVAIGDVGGSISLPIFEPGPSKAQRKRDSIVHAGNVERFARIFARLRQRQDSMLLAAARDSGERRRIRDSLTRAHELEP